MKMEPRDFSSKKRYVAAIIIGTAVFLLVFGLSYSLSYLELKRVSGLQDDSSYAIFEDRLSYSFFNESICAGATLQEVTRDLGFQGRIMDDLERKLGKHDPVVLARKKFYVLVELEHMEFVNLLNERCNGQVNTILFFYSNSESKIEAAEEAGRILGVAHGRNQNLVIYSFDVDLDSEIVKKLKAKYDITGSNVAVINEAVSLQLPANILEIEEHFY